MSREQLQARHAEVIAKARAVVVKAKAESRGLTTTEQATIDQHLAEAKSIADQAKSADILGGLDALAAAGIVGKSRSTIDDGRRLSFAGMAAKAATNILGDGIGTKSLAPSGATVVGQGFTPDPIPLGRAATGLLDVLPVIEHDSPAFSYLRQGLTGRTINAAVVAENAVKPTSPLGVERIDTVLSVLASLSELIPRYYLLDNLSLQNFVDQELRYGLSVAVERLVLATINGTSGIQLQTFASSPVVTIRKALTRLEGVGLVAGALVLNPSDWEIVELALSTVNAIEHMSLPFDPAARRLFGVPVAVTVSQAPTVCHVLSTDSVAVDTDRYGVQVQWSETATADSFSKNQIVCRTEGRYAVSTFRPLGICKAALA